MVVAAPTALENADNVAGLLGGVPWKQPRAFVSGIFPHYISFFSREGGAECTDQRQHGGTV